MANKLDPATARAAREDARRLEKQVARTEPYPESTAVSRANQPSRMLNLRLTEDQFSAIQELAPNDTYRCRPWRARGCSTESIASSTPPEPYGSI